MKSEFGSNIEYLSSLKVVHRISDGLVTTNGCFDILHIGHLRALAQARSFGQRLVVGINSDESVRRLKGNGRPVFTELDRAELLISLRFVDQVVIFSESDPVKFLRALKPEVHCKGADYSHKILEMPETEVLKEWGGVIEFTDLVSNRSTTITEAHIMDLKL